MSDRFLEREIEPWLPWEDYPSEEDHLYSSGPTNNGVCHHHMGPGQPETYPDAGTSPTAHSSICFQQLSV